LPKVHSQSRSAVSTSNSYCWLLTIATPKVSHIETSSLKISCWTANSTLKLQILDLLALSKAEMARAI